MTNPLPHHKLRELDLIIEEVTHKITHFLNIISSHYDKIIHTTRRLQVLESDVNLFKAVAAFLQVEKIVKNSKVYKALTAIMQTAEAFRNERSKEMPQQPQQAPAQTIPAVKYKAAEINMQCP